MKGFYKIIALAIIVGLTGNCVFAATKEKFNRTTTTETSNTKSEKEAAALAYDKGYQAGLKGTSSKVTVPKEYAANSKEYTEGYKKGYAYKQAADLAYNKGYQAGLKGTSSKVKIPKEYAANSKEYTEGYQKGYSEKQAADQAATNAYNKGYEAGSKGTSATASVPSAYSANASDYTRGYQKGYSDRQTAYNAGFDAGYIVGETMGTSDTPSSIPSAYSKFASAYKMGFGSGWATKRTEIIIYNEGYAEGLRGVSAPHIPRQYESTNWMASKYKEGYEKGFEDYLSSPQGIKDAKIAYEAGYSDGLDDGKRYLDTSNLNVPNIYTSHKSKYTEGYNKGFSEALIQRAYNEGYNAPPKEPFPISAVGITDYTIGYTKGANDKESGKFTAYPVNEELIKYSSMVYVKGGQGTGKTVESGGEGLVDGTYDISSYYIGNYEVTQEFYESVINRRSGIKFGRGTYELETKPSAHVEDSLVRGEVQSRRPVESITWYDALYFCNVLSELQGLKPAYTITIKSIQDAHITDADVSWDKTANGYRLPSEKEWEFACRGGDPNAKDFTFSFSGVSDKSYTFGNETSKALDNVGWYSYNPSGVTTNTQGSNGVSGYCTHEVGKKKANRLGIYDMSGNVAEMVFDIGDDNERVNRGGSYAATAAACHVIAWNDTPASYRMTGLGFRIARNAE